MERRQTVYGPKNNTLVSSLGFLFVASIPDLQLPRVGNVRLVGCIRPTESLVLAQPSQSQFGLEIHQIYSWLIFMLIFYGSRMHVINVQMTPGRKKGFLSQPGKQDAILPPWSFTRDDVESMDSISPHVALGKCLPLPPLE